MSITAQLLRYLKPYARRFAYAVLAMAAVALFNGASVLLLKPIVDKVFIARDFWMLWLAVVCVPLIAALKTAASYVQNYLMSWLGQRVTQDIREDLLRRLHALPLEYFADKRSAELLSRATGDLIVMQSALNSLPLYLIRDSMTVLVLLASLFYLDWRFALLSLLGIPLICATLLVLSKKMRASSLQSQMMMGQIYQRFQDSLQSMAAIKALNYERASIDKFREENDLFFSPTMRYLRATALSAPLMELSGSLVAAVILYFSGREVIQGRMTPGSFFAFLGSFFAAYAPVKNIARSNSELQRAAACAERIFQLLAEKPSLARQRCRAGFDGLKKEIRLDSVFFRYPQSKSWALQNLSLSIPRGSRVAVIGPSRSGKTTLARLLLLLHEPERGAVLIDGTDARQIDCGSLREQAGALSPEAVIFNDTIFANVSLDRQVVTMSAVEAACRACGADDFISKLPQGYQTRVGESGVPLLQSQQRRLELARILLKNPSILILDDALPAAGDPSAEELLRVMDSLFQNRTVIMTARRAFETPKVDAIFHLAPADSRSGQPQASLC